MFRLQSKFVFIGILSCVIVALLAVFAVSVAPASADDHFPGNNRGSSSHNTATTHGTISAVAGNSLTITPANGGNLVTLTLDAHSEVSLSGADALASGQMVNATYNSQTMVAERVIVNISVPSNTNRPTITEVHGTISAVAGNSLTITPANGGNPVTLTLDAHSDVNLAGAGSLATGQAVNATYNSRTMVAERVVVNSSIASDTSRPTIADVQGTLSAVAGNSLTITPSNGGNAVTLTLDAHSDINLAGVDSLAAGQTVSATYNSQTMVAERVVVNSSISSNTSRPAIADVQGTLSAVAGNSLTITPANGGNAVTLTLDAHSDINLSGVDALAAGQTVGATYNSQTMVAERVIVNSSTSYSSENRTGNHNTGDHGGNDSHGWFSDRITQGLGWFGRLFHWGSR